MPINPESEAQRRTPKWVRWTAVGAALLLVAALAFPLFRHVHFQVGDAEWFVITFRETDLIYPAGYTDFRHPMGWRSRMLVLKIPVEVGRWEPGRAFFVSGWWCYLIEYRTP